MGDELFGLVTEATGLPQDMISAELNRILEKAGVQKSSLTLEVLRKILAEYVQDVLLAAKEDLAEPEKAAANE